MVGKKRAQAVIGAAARPWVSWWPPGKATLGTAWQFVQAFSTGAISAPRGQALVLRRAKKFKILQWFVALQSSNLPNNI